MDEKHNEARCKQCDHLLSFHGEDGCGTWLLGVRAVPLYRCACVHAVGHVMKRSITPTVAGRTTLPTVTSDHTALLRQRLQELATEVRRTGEELHRLERELHAAIARVDTPVVGERERRRGADRRQRQYAMIAERRMGDRRRPIAA